LEQRDRLMPTVDKEFFFPRLGQTFPALSKRRARVALFAGCISQVSFVGLHEATIRVLTANGCEVVVPERQLCCGALAAHAGVRDVARKLARVNVHAFLPGDFDAVITNAAGCGSTLKEYDQLFSAGDPEHESAHQFRGKVRDVTEFLDALGVTAPLHDLRMRVTYQDSCHLAHGQKIREAPRRLIRAIPGVELVEMRWSDNCCGSAGVYNVTQTHTSLALLADKMRCAADAGAPTIVTSNPGCMLQLRAGSEIHKTGQQVLHVIELIDRALHGTAGC
jgi:glycolate oxidase iron-sulfur subunit